MPEPIPATTNTGTARTTTGFASLCHPACIACRDPDQGALGLRFQELADGSVTASFACDRRYQGYADRLHGGVAAMLIDAAMVHCLFARGLCGVTARLTVKFRLPIKLGVEAAVRARAVRESPPLYVLEAEIVQDGSIRAVAEGMLWVSA